MSWEKEGKRESPLHQSAAPPLRPVRTVPQLPHLCWLVRGHAPAQLEALPAGLRGPASRRGGGGSGRAFLLLPKAVPLDLLADEQLPEPLALRKIEC